MVFDFKRTTKYENRLKYFMSNNFQNILKKVAEIENVLESGSWLSSEIKKQYKIEKLYDEQGNLWKCKYIYKKYTTAGTI